MTQAIGIDCPRCTVECARCTEIRELKADVKRLRDAFEEATGEIARANRAAREARWGGKAGTYQPFQQFESGTFPSRPWKPSDGEAAWTAVRDDIEELLRPKRRQYHTLMREASRDKARAEDAAARAILDERRRQRAVGIPTVATRKGMVQRLLERVSKPRDKDGAMAAAGKSR